MVRQAHHEGSSKGCRSNIILIIVYVIEMAILGFIYRFLPKVPYKLVAPPVVVDAMLVAWLAIYIDIGIHGWGHF